MHRVYPLMMAAVAGVPDDTFKNVLKSKLVQVSAIQERAQSSQRLVAISTAIEQIKGATERQESTDVAWAALDGSMTFSRGNHFSRSLKPIATDTVLSFMETVATTIERWTRIEDMTHTATQLSTVSKLRDYIEDKPEWFPQLGGSAWQV